MSDCECGGEVCPLCWQAVWERATPVELTVSPHLRVVSHPSWMRVVKGPRTWAAGSTLTLESS